MDSEAKVVRHWQGQQQAGAVHMLGHGGGCGNNWSCGYSLAHSTGSSSSSSGAWPANSSDSSRCDQVLDGIRREAERQAGVPDFLLLASLAGGTGSGFGSALIESLADEYACSTVAAAAVAPGRAGGSDTATQSINCCLALQHLSAYAHVVLLFDNQILLDQLNASSSKLAASSSTGSSGWKGSGGQLAAVSGRACLQGVNELAAQALAGLLWPVGEADQLARRTSIRQLVCTVAADPLTKFLEVAHVTQPDAEIPVNMQGSPWPARIRLLASQLPAYDPFRPAQPVSTTAALVVARGRLCTQASKAGSSKTHTPGRLQDAGSQPWHVTAPGSCWVAGSSGSVGGWHAGAAAVAVSSSWPRWAGSSWDVHVADCAMPLWSPRTRTCTSSLTAAARRSSTGSFLRDVSAKCRQLSGAGAYMHWYREYGTGQADIEAAALVLDELAAGY